MTDTVRWLVWPTTSSLVSEMTYNVSSGTLNLTIPYYTNTNNIVRKMLCPLT